MKISEELFNKILDTIMEEMTDEQKVRAEHRVSRLLLKKATETLKKITEVCQT